MNIWQYTYNRKKNENKNKPDDKERRKPTETTETEKQNIDKSNPTPHDPWQADIIEMHPYLHFNRGHHYILSVIDVLSKYT